MSTVLAIDINQNTFAPARVTSISSIVNVFIPLVLTAAAILLLGMFFLGGYKILVSQGNAEKFEQAQMLITYSVIGFIIVVLAFFLTRLLGFITNVAIPL